MLGKQDYNITEFEVLAQIKPLMFKMLRVYNKYKIDLQIPYYNKSTQNFEL